VSGREREGKIGVEMKGEMRVGGEGTNQVWSGVMVMAEVMV